MRNAINQIPFFTNIVKPKSYLYILLASHPTTELMNATFILLYAYFYSSKRIPSRL